MVIMSALAHAESALSLPAVEGAVLKPLSFSDLTGWASDNHADAFKTFLRTCRRIVDEEVSLRKSARPSQDLRNVCTAALSFSSSTDPDTARLFFEHHFKPYMVLPQSGNGFLTGYYEPEFSGRLSPDERYTTPLLARPEDLVTFTGEEVILGLDPSLRAARRIKTSANEHFEPYPDRAAIEDGALGKMARILAYLEPVDAFMAHIQGSVRVRLIDTKDATCVRRFAYAGRNGHPYTSVAKLVVAETGISPAELTAPKLVMWLRENPNKAKRLMRENKSYIFFRHADDLLAEEGPIGGSSVQLTTGRSIAIDRRLWPYGIPVWIEAQLPPSIDDTGFFNRLMITQDTGSAIVGPARADIFFGSGDHAGNYAGRIRHVPEKFVVFLPKKSKS